MNKQAETVVLSANTGHTGIFVRLKELTEGLGSFIAVVIACIVFALINPDSFFSLNNLRTLLDQSAVPIIIVCGLTFVILMGSVDLSIEGIMAAASLVFVLLSANSRNANDLGMAAPFITAAIGVVFGMTSGFLQTLLRIPSFMVSLGFWFIGLGIATFLYGSDVPMLSDPVLRGGSSRNHIGISNAVGVALCCVVVSYILAMHTKFGRFTYAIGANENIARLNSIPVNAYKIAVFAYCGLCVGVAAIIGSSRLGVGTPDVGSGQLFLCTASVIIGGTPLSGGKGGILQSVCGVFLLVIVSNGLILAGANPITQQALSGLIIVSAVVMTGIRHRSNLRVVK